MNALTLVPAKVRLWLYVVYGVAALAVSSTAIFYTAVGSGIPKWVGGAAAVLGGLAAPFGALAGSNVTKRADGASPVVPDTAAVIVPPAPNPH